MEQRGGEVRVRDLLDAEGVEHLQVLFRFCGFELGDGNLSVVNGEEVYKLLEVIDLLVGDLYRGLECQYVAFLL